MPPADTLYFIGIAGHAISGLAVAAARKGYAVSGVAENGYPPATDVLAASGIPVHSRYDAAHILPGMRIVLGNGIPSDNEEVRRAAELGLPIISFPQLIEEWSRQQQRIVVAGSHGKTTTSTLIAWILQTAGYGPDFLMGMAGANFGQSARHEVSAVMVLEGDEYSSSSLDETSKFMYYHPTTLVLTSLEWDHPDLFPDFEMMIDRFANLVEQMPPAAPIGIPATDERCRELISGAHRQAVTFSVDGTPASVMAHAIDFGRHETSFAVRIDGEEYGTFHWRLAGVHNIANALAALVALTPWRIPATVVAEALASFAGADRRFQIVGEVERIAVIDDYAHHPTEVKATIEACRARYVGGKLWAFFEPHTFSRTQALAPDLAAALSGADVVMVSDIVGARENGDDFTVRTADILAQLGEGVLSYHTGPDGAARLVIENAQPGDTVLCMSVTGAGRLAQRITGGLDERFHS